MNMPGTQPIDVPRSNHPAGPNVVSNSSTNVVSNSSTNVVSNSSTKTPEGMRPARPRQRRRAAGLPSPRSATPSATLLNLIVADRWRLKRATQVDEAFSQARTWAEQAHNLQLLTMYEWRIHRATEKRAAAKEPMKQAK